MRPPIALFAILAPLCLGSALGALPASADVPKDGCFDLATGAGVRPLAKPLAFGPGETGARKDITASGPNPQGGGWGSARAILDLPIADTLRLLRDQTTLKNPDESDVTVKHETHPGLLDWQSVDITIHPFPLISIDWTEQWAYKITQGTEAKPQEVLIAYQKVSGTEHIKHFCGNIWLRADGGKTDFAVYEETEATRRSNEAIAQGHLGTIRTIRERAKQASKQP